jgi:hypothetical protein
VDDILRRPDPMQLPHLAANYLVTTTTKTIRDFETAPALVLDHSEELRMGLSNEQLIGEAVECSHTGIGRTTLHKYESHLVHFAQYLGSAHRSDFLPGQQETGPAVHGLPR